MMQMEGFCVAGITDAVEPKYASAELSKIRYFVKDRAGTYELIAAFPGYHRLQTYAKLRDAAAIISAARRYAVELGTSLADIDAKLNAVVAVASPGRIRVLVRDCVISDFCANALRGAATGSDMILPPGRSARLVRVEVKTVEAPPYVHRQRPNPDPESYRISRMFGGNCGSTIQTEDGKQIWATSARLQPMNLLIAGYLNKLRDDDGPGLPAGLLASIHTPDLPPVPPPRPPAPSLDDDDDDEDDSGDDEDCSTIAAEVPTV